MSLQRRKLGILAGTLCGALSLCGVDASVYGQSGSSSSWMPSRTAIQRNADNSADDDSDEPPPARPTSTSRSLAAEQAPAPSAAPARPMDAPRSGSVAPIPWYQQNQRQQGGMAQNPTPAPAQNYASPRSNSSNSNGSRISNNDAGDQSSPTRQAGSVRRTAYVDSSYYTPQDGNGGPTSVQRPARSVMTEGPMNSQPHMVSGPMNGGEEMSSMGMDGSSGDFMGNEPSCGCSSGHCSSGSCGSGGCSSGGCGNGSCGCNSCCPLCGLLCDWWQDDWDRDLTFAIGVQSFKSPVDAQNNPLAGHFGFYEGVNWGTPIWDAIGLGGQIGVNFFESDLTNEESSQNEHRDQMFLTAGLFHRAVGDCGVQGGLVYDYLYDSHIPEVQHATLGQLRGDLSWVYKCHDFGFDFATSLKNYTATDTFDGFTVSDLYRPVDTYTLHYDRKFCNGGEARIFGGYANGLGGLAGATIDMPLMDHLSLNTSFVNVIPGGRPTGEAERTESWAMGIALVWHPGCCARDANGSPYKPLFNVADNGSFIVNEHIGD